MIRINLLPHRAEKRKLRKQRFYGFSVAMVVIGALIGFIVHSVYSGYIERQRGEVERAAHYENLRLPAELDYMQVTALSFEVRQTLSKQRPETLGLASRMSGVTPAAISLLMVHLKKQGFKTLVAG